MFHGQGAPVGGDAFAGRADPRVEGGTRSAPARLAELPGGIELAELLRSPSWDDADPAELVELTAAWERVAAWAHSQAAAAAVRLSHAPEMNPSWPDHVGRPKASCLAGTELSLRLGRTVTAATRLVDTGRLLATVLTETGDALAVGLIDWPKAETFAEVLAEVPGQVALEAEEAVLPDAPVLTVTQLRKKLAQAVLEVDPEEAQERHAAARGRRRVTRPRVLADGMASITAFLPADVAVRLDACLQSAAEVARKRPGERRTADQLRADALDALATSAWDAGRIGPCTGDDEHGWSLVGTRGRRTQVQVTVGIGTLLGLDEEPAHLAGYGPVGADVARALAAERSTWRRLLADDATGAVLDVGTETYEPPASLVRLIRARNSTCVVPTCGVPARLCQLDHTVPFGSEHRGATSTSNLGPLCTTHHLYKTHGGYRLEQPAPGAFVLTTPTGHVFLTEPDRQPGLPFDPGRSWEVPPEGSVCERALRVSPAAEPPTRRWWLDAAPPGWEDLVPVECGPGGRVGDEDTPPY